LTLWPLGCSLSTSAPLQQCLARACRPRKDVRLALASKPAVAATVNRQIPKPFLLFRCRVCHLQNAGVAAFIPKFFAQSRNAGEASWLERLSTVIPRLHRLVCMGVDDSRVSRGSGTGWPVSPCSTRLRDRPYSPVATSTTPGQTIRECKTPALDAAFQAQKGLTQHVPASLPARPSSVHHIATSLFVPGFSQAGKNGAAINGGLRSKPHVAFGGAAHSFGETIAALLPQDFQHVHAWLVRNLYRLFHLS